MISTINLIIGFIAKSIESLFSILPNSPFNYIANIDSTLLAAINWLIPIEMLITHLGYFVFAVGMYYIVRIPLRWLKAAGG